VPLPRQDLRTGCIHLYFLFLSFLCSVSPRTGWDSPLESNWLEKVVAELFWIKRQEFNLQRLIPRKALAWLNNLWSTERMKNVDFSPRFKPAIARVVKPSCSSLQPYPPRRFRCFHMHFSWGSRENKHILGAQYPRSPRRVRGGFFSSIGHLSEASLILIKWAGSVLNLQ